MTTSTTPNHIPAKDRITNTLLSVFLLLYGGYGIWENDLYLPSKHSNGIHLHDVPAWVMYGAFICACMVMLSVVADHYDKRNNEVSYTRFAKTFRVLGWCFFGLSLILKFVN